MNFACGVLTHKAFGSDRFHMLRQTVRSLLAAFSADVPVYVLDNDSPDESPTRIRQEFGSIDRVRLRFARHPDGNHTPGRGHNTLLDWMMHDEQGRADVLLFSDDDVRWREDAGERLDLIYSAPPSGAWDESVVILCGYLEPDFHWATPRARAEPGGVPVLIRDSVPSAAWTYRVKCTPNWPVVHGAAPAYKAWKSGGPTPVEETFASDSRLCETLRESRLKVAAADLADHLGCGVSTHNNSPMANVRPLDRKHWRI